MSCCYLLLFFWDTVKYIVLHFVTGSLLKGSKWTQHVVVSECIKATLNILTASDESVILQITFIKKFMTMQVFLGRRICIYFKLLLHKINIYIFFIVILHYYILVTILNCVYIKKKYFTLISVDVFRCDIYHYQCLDVLGLRGIDNGKCHMKTC